MATQLKEPEPIVEESRTSETAPPVAEAEERDYEAEARGRGWKPPEEFGEGEPRPRKFKTAEEFIRDGEEELPLVKKQVAQLRREREEDRKLIKRLVRSEQNAFQNALAEIRREMEQAVETGDVATFKALDERADQIRKDMAGDAATPDTHGEDPNEQYDAFREANPWYDKANLASATETEIEARLHADRLADKYARQGLMKELAPSEFFAKIAEETEAKFPLLKAKALRPKPASDVAGVTRTAPNKSAKTGANLPAEAKQQAKRFFDQGIIKADNLNAAYDKYAQSYDWN